MIIRQDRKHPGEASSARIATLIAVFFGGVMFLGYLAFHGRPPIVKVIVPVNYSGPIQVQLEGANLLGSRRVTITIPPSGLARAKIDFPFRNWFPNDNLIVKDADGGAIAVDWSSGGDRSMVRAWRNIGLMPATLSKPEVWWMHIGSMQDCMSSTRVYLTELGVRQMEIQNSR